MMKKLVYLILCLLLLSCEKQVEWPLAVGSKRPIVVDGIITDEYKVHQLRLHRPVDSLNGIPEAVSGAKLRISSIDTMVFFIEKEPGIYESSVPIKPQAEKNYRLTILHQEREFEAVSHLREGRNFIPLIYGKATTSNLYEVKWVAPDYQFLDPAMYSLEMDWSHLPQYSDSTAESCRAFAWYYALPSLDASRIFAPDQQNILFPRGTIIIEKRYALSKDYAAYIRALLLETTWTGGILDPGHANLPTNLSEGAIGYFACCGVTIDTVIVK